MMSYDLLKSTKVATVSGISPFIYLPVQAKEADGRYMLSLYTLANSRFLMHKQPLLRGRRNQTDSIYMSPNCRLTTIGTRGQSGY